MDFMRTKDKVTAVAHLFNDKVCIHARRMAFLVCRLNLPNYALRYNWKAKTLTLVKRVHLQKAKQLEIMKRYLNRYKEGEDYELEFINDENN